MAPAQYHFASHWRVHGTPREVFEIISKAEDLPRWWPAAFTDSLPIQTGDETGRARVVRLESRGFLPGRLRWHVVATESEPPRRLLTEVWGDIEGTGTWTIEQDGESYVALDYDWRIEPRMPLANLLSPLVKPWLAANHRWAMAKGQKSLQLELDRLHAANSAESGLLPPPPSGAEPPAWVPAFGLGALFAIVMLLRHRGTSPL